MYFNFHFSCKRPLLTYIGKSLELLVCMRRSVQRANNEHLSLDLLVQSRTLVYMASESWLESSLRRSSQLGQEVLEKAKRRSVNCSSTRHVFDRNEMKSERDLFHSNLDHAFAKIVEYMSETTRQCKKFYETVHLAQPSEREHICRYHSQQKQNASATIKRDVGSSEPEDFLIEVSPGTYSITAAMQDTKPQTKTVRINAGESMNLTFSL